MATSQANIVKNALLAARSKAAESQLALDPTKLTVDSPVPYFLGDPSGLDEFGQLDGQKYETGLVGEINAQRPMNKNKKDHEDYNKVLRKLDSLIKDDRLAFMMKDWDGREDPMPSVLDQILGKGAPVRIVDLSGVPNEVAGTASAVIARTLFSLKIWQGVEERNASPVLLVCERRTVMSPTAVRPNTEGHKAQSRGLQRRAESTESGSSLSRSAQAKSRQPCSRNAILGLSCALLTRRTEHMCVGYFPIRWQG